MILRHDAARDLAIDGAKASPLAVYAATVAGGIDWGQVAAAMAALYSAILVGEKLWRYVVQPLWKRFGPRAAA